MPWRVLVRYGAALASVALALAARFALTGLLPAQGFPFLTFFPAVLLTAYFAGLGPGLLASFASILAAWYFFIPPSPGFAPISTADLVALVFFSAILLIDCLVIHLMNRALARARAVETQLREADARKDEFLAMLAHELRNPLAPVLNAVQVIGRGEALSTRGRRALDMIERQARQMKRLVDDLLEASRFSRGRITLQMGTVQLDTLLEQAVEAMQPAFEAAGQTLVLHPPPDLPPLLADPARLMQVMENLLTNALRYTPRGGRTEVTARRLPAGIEVHVRDDGIGIPPDRLERIFELFHQVDAGDERSAGGLGVGLALVRRLVELHGGRVHAESAGPGQGTTVVVWLPTA